MRLPVRYRRADGTARISVTQVLTVAGRIDAQWFTPEATARGSLVHDLTESIDRGGDPIIPVEVYGYVAAYRTFLAAVQPEWTDIERLVASDDLDLAGRIDRRAAHNLFGQPGILDIKTGEPQPWHALQLAAYNQMLPTGPRWGLYLRPTGRFKVVRYDDDAAYRAFYADLARVRGTLRADGEYWVPQ